MLKVDLGRLDAERRVSIDAAIPVGDPLWEDTDFRPAAPVTVHLVAEKAGPDIVVRGRFRGELEAPCRRCLNPVRVGFGEDVTFLFRSGLDPISAESEEAYPLPARARELDLGPALREHVLLAIPAFVLCRDDCKGLCPRCGTDRNRNECDCEEEHGDERWAALRRLQIE
jgi:uncharacterized protein